MPLPMVHLSVAVKLFNHDDIPPSFLLGSIAPDAIHMRKNTNREDKWNTHFNIDSGNNTDLIKDKYRSYIDQNADPEWYWFVRGYFAHVLTDYYWFRQIFSKFREKAEADNLSPQQTSKVYYADTDQFDFSAYRMKKWTSEIWKKLIHARTFALEPYLSADEINYWRFRTVHWFDLLAKEPGVTPKYITETIIENFIASAAEMVQTELAQWENRAGTTIVKG